MLPKIARFRLLRLAVSAAVLTTLLSGCAPRVETSMVDSGTAYTMAGALKKAASADLGRAASLATADAPRARNDALVQLRTHGDSGAAVADLLTKSFGTQTRSVPVSAEGATVDGVKAWIVIEAAPGAAGKLTTRRLWVFNRSTGAVIRSASYR